MQTVLQEKKKKEDKSFGLVFFFLNPSRWEGSKMKLLLTVCLSGVGYRGWFPASDACISLWSWSTGSDWGRSRRNWAGGENTESLGELQVSWAWLVFAGVDLPQFWTAGSWQGKKKFPSPEVQEEGTHQHVFAIKLRQFDSPTAHPPLPLCTSLKIRLFPPLCNCGAERETLRLWFIFALFLFFLSSQLTPHLLLGHFSGSILQDAPLWTMTKKWPRASRADGPGSSFLSQNFWLSTVSANW